LKKTFVYRGMTKVLGLASREFITKTKKTNLKATDVYQICPSEKCCLLFDTARLERLEENRVIHRLEKWWSLVVKSRKLLRVCPIKQLKNERYKPRSKTNTMTENSTEERINVTSIAS